jgi:N-acetylglucosaminyldiphosphoundecaprenol N-acetyl-beta-D-mannosaminyltransferase
VAGQESGVEWFEVAGVPVSLINMDSACEEVERRIVSRCGGFCIFRDMNGIVEANRDQQLLEAHRGAAFVGPDGMPLVWLARLMGFKHVSRVYGPDFLIEFCRRTEHLGYRHFFFGSTDAINARLVIELQQRFPGLLVCGRYAPAFRAAERLPNAEDLQQIRAARPNLVWVGLGTPKQEFWMQLHAPELRESVLLGVGAAFDFHSKTKPQAPRWLRQAGFEWCFRLLSEPRRLGRRYLLGIPKFLWLLIIRGCRRRDPTTFSPSN